MSLTLRCKCGRTLKVADEVIGRSIRCRCGRVLKVRGVRQSGPRTLPERLRDVRRGLRGWLATPVREGVRRVLWRISLAYLGGAIVAWPFLFGLGDRWWPATVLLFGPRWVLLLPLAVLVPAALALLPRALLPLLAGGLIVAGPVMGFSLGWQSLLAGDDAGDIRIVSFNAQSGAALGGPGAAETALLEWDADIVALQECPHEAIFDATREMPGLAVHADKGLCLVSRFPILSIDSLPAWRIGELGWAGAVLRYALDTGGGRTLQFTNLHLDTPGRGLEELREQQDPRLLAVNLEMREIASRRAANWVREGGRPAVVAGDFNTPGESAIFRQYWGHLDDAFAEAGWGYGGTRVLRWFSVRIDHILSTGELRPVRAVTGRDLGSDHLPVIADLEWTADE